MRGICLTKFIPPWVAVLGVGRYSEATLLTRQAIGVLPRYLGKSRMRNASKLLVN